MKRIVYLVIAFFIVSNMAMAQAPRGGNDRNIDPKTRAERMTERMVKDYSLTDEQKAQVYEANLALMQKMGTIMQGDRDKQREEMGKSRDAYNVQLKKIMTEEQYATYTKNQSGQRNERTGRERERGERRNN
ncbi:hypothetical protein EZS27_003363 [termite gut metagenome]|uniref:DUF4890 domain-containing protein n=1 Tax=termite gut metagenome TaxID=433724 RepID=A0A5J4STP6_9ZZZZ